MPEDPDSCPYFSSDDLDDLVVPDTPEHLWPSYPPIVARYPIGARYPVENLTDTVVPETEPEFLPKSEMFEYFGGESPFYGPPPPATPFYGPPPPAAATSVDIPQASPIVYSDVEKEMFAILLPKFLVLI